MIDNAENQTPITPPLSTTPVDTTPDITTPVEAIAAAAVENKIAEAEVKQLQTDPHAVDIEEQKPSNFWAVWVSNILSPPVIWGVMAFPIAFRKAETFSGGFGWAMLYVLLICVVPATYIVYQVARGEITDVHVRIRAQRIRPFMITLASGTVALLAYLVLRAPRPLPIFTLMTLIQIAAVLIITIEWQISMHALASSSALVTIFALFGLPAALIAAPLVPIICGARYRLRRHTIPQLVGGAVVGSTLTAVLIALTRPF